MLEMTRGIRFSGEPRATLIDSAARRGTAHQIEGGFMTEHAVVIAGGGPTGLMLAAELALAGVDAAIVERRPNQNLAGVRAGGLHARTIEVLDQRGIADRFLDAGTVAQVAGFAWIRLNISDAPSRRPYGLALQQNQIERLLAEWVAELKAPISYGCELIAFTQDESGVDITLSDDSSIRAQYLVGCDGGRSLVRKSAGIAFPGWEPTVSHLIAEVEMTEEPELGLRNDAHGIHSIGKMDDGRTMRVMITEAQPGRTEEPTLGDLSDALIEIYGTDFGVHSPTWLSRFTDAARQAESYRAGRVLLAGDAAHVHYPTGGQGLNTGVQDAVNLGWKLAQVVQRISPESLLDTYHAERHPVGSAVLQLTMAQSAALRADDSAKALHGVLTDLLGLDEPRRRYGAIMSGLAIHYDLGEGHPLLGRRMPDLDLSTKTGPMRVSSLLHGARPLLLNLGTPGSLDHTPWTNRVPLVEASYDGVWELPAIGPVAAPSAVLVRPDGYVAWVGDETQAGLHEALERWFGPPAETRTV
jgi:2-polyprenyl-6-methoxyphenol hydroxylase-like FAD-dependent oxidoreductase